MSVNKEESKSYQSNWSEFANRKPITVLILITLVCVIFRLLDTFLLPFTELVGELILSKSLGFILIILYLWSINRKPNAIGIHKKNASQSLVIGFLVAVLMIYMYYLMILVVTESSGIEGTLQFAPTDPKTGLRGDSYFALWLVFGNVMNVFMEEGLFRGLMIRKFLDKMTFWKTNFLQALLFGIWHITWPIKDFLDGETSFGAFISESIFATISPFLIGLIWGYIFYKSNSLFAPLICHFLWNSTLNIILFIPTLEQEIANVIAIAGATALLAGFLSLYLIKLLVKGWKLPQLESWSAGENNIRK